MALSKGWPTKHVGFPVITDRCTPMIDLLRNVVSKVPKAAQLTCRPWGQVLLLAAKGKTCPRVLGQWSVS